MMKPFLHVALGCVMLTMGASACQETQTPQDSLAGTTWVLYEFTPAGSPQAVLPTGQYTISFHADGSYEVSLDVNMCGGNFQESGSSIEMESAACTEMCCDSEDALVWAGMLSDMVSFELTDDELTLSGQGSMVLIP
ncbi:META domain-containing protein [Pontibacter sp. G13]|uniref:META domain-containing protein n=1 Tax=Pontibacter sp. G13 TaxID=3074898 RepID=UPI00288B27AC|nr:META domain-containing protein [Pontibacter sp. G13]WNJ18226.1 META domain-containing protein [Pontibacter sp. G13]